MQRRTGRVKDIPFLTLIIYAKRHHLYRRSRRNGWQVVDEYIDINARWPQDGEHISLPGMKGIYEVRGVSLYNHGRLAIPLCLVEKYKIEK